MERTGFCFEVIQSTPAEEDNVLAVTELCDMTGVQRFFDRLMTHKASIKKRRVSSIAQAVQE